MTKAEFEAFHAICRTAWLELAETGGTEKPAYLNRFKSQCPSCEIAVRLEEINTDRGACDCCPVDEWRNGVYCLSGLFGRWECSSDIAERKSIARQISDLKWSYLPEYENISGELP